MSKKLADLTTRFKAEREKAREVEAQWMNEREQLKEKLKNSVNNTIELKSVENNGNQSSKSKTKNKKYLAAMSSINQTLSGSKTTSSDQQ